MKAGFGRVCINPALGTAMTGFGGRDREKGCEGIHDDIHVRALYLEHQGKEALILGFDLLFFSRDEADRYKGALGRQLDLRPSEILLNTSHSHSGPKVGTWLYCPESDLLYLQELELRMVEAAQEARASARQVSLWAGLTRSHLPICRRLKLPDGTVDRSLRPYHQGEVCDALPICLFQDRSGQPVCLLFSVSCHPSTLGSFLISAEYPGAAMRLLDEHLGTGASLFLQGAGGDAKPRVTAVDSQPPRFRPGTWEDVEAAGRLVAGEVIQALEAGLTQVEPELAAAGVEMEWPMLPAPDAAGFAAVLDDPAADETLRLWAREKLEVLRRGYRLPVAVPLTAHGVQFGRGVRLVGLEGEAVAGLGNAILDFYPEGVTFPLGYTDGAQAYLPTDAMLDEGGYEVVSFYEYRQPARLARGIDQALQEALQRLRAAGIR